MEAGLSEILTLVGQFGWSTIFLWLFVREQRLHNETRQLYVKDLREIAGVRSSMWQTEQLVKKNKEGQIEKGL